VKNSTYHAFSQEIEEQEAYLCKQNQRKMALNENKQGSIFICTEPCIKLKKEKKGRKTRRREERGGTTRT
jgi:ssDNA-binding Zn-finger/Zn-ribbon topoisomerase 1